MLVDDADPEHTSKVRRKTSQSAFNQILSCQTCFLPEKNICVANHTYNCSNRKLFTCNIRIFQFYDDWSEKYDDDLVVVGNYNGFIKVAEAFIKLGLDHQVE